MDHTEHSSGGQRERQRDKEGEGGGCQIKEERQEERLRDMAMFASLRFFFFLQSVWSGVLHHGLRYLCLSD